jgi:hypothetical protein
MGRYYNGDIEGKFWFGCQSSDDGEFFGAKEQEPEFVDYIIDTKDIPKVHQGIQECKEALGEHLMSFQEAYNSGLGKNTKWQKLNIEEQDEKYEWFARLDMGMRILIHFHKLPGHHCEFTAEF